MIKRWLKRILRDVIDESYNAHIIRVADKLTNMEGRLGQVDTSRFGSQAHTLQCMMNELKGIVAMSRAALDEGRKFTEIREIGNILSLTSEKIHEFDLNMERMNRCMTQLDLTRHAMATHFERICELNPPKKNPVKRKKKVA